MYDARKDVRAFIIGNDQDTGISLGKRMTTPGEVHLVIGLGGAENYCLNANGPGRPFEVLSCLRYRIGVVSWRFGMALSDLNIYQRYEEAMRR